MTMQLSSKKDIVSFQKIVYTYYRRHGRSLPWRATSDPYKILVSEIMLQQTQVSRVIEKYSFFLQQFPTLRSLAGASQESVLGAWQGLGYNRRALYLRQLAKQVVGAYQGIIPEDPAELIKLCGIGTATAASISAFAFNKPVVFVETNIRSVFIHHFFPSATAVADSELLPLVAAALDRRNPRKWYSALMDYGTHLKAVTVNPSRRSRHYLRQSTFEGSDRQIRGKVIRILVQKGTLTHPRLMRLLDGPQPRIMRILDDLTREGFIRRRRNVYTL